MDSESQHSEACRIVSAQGSSGAPVPNNDSSRSDHIPEDHSPEDHRPKDHRPKDHSPEELGQGTEPALQHSYSSCGLRIHSSHPLPGLLPDRFDAVLDPTPLQIFLEASPKLLEREELSERSWSHLLDSSVSDDSGRPLLVMDRLILGELDGDPRVDGEVFRKDSGLRKEGGGSLFRFTYADGTVFWLDAVGQTIWARWPSGSSLEEAAIYLTGPVFGLALRLRGLLPLHASSVVIGGGAVAFVGAPQAGKSTTAAAFALAGYRILADDTSVIRRSKTGGLEVAPDGPRLRLWPESAELLFGRRDALPELSSGWHKGRFDLTADSVQARSTPLRAIYFLDGEQDEHEGAGFWPSTATESVVRLVANLAVPSFPDRDMHARDLEQLSQLVTEVPIRRWVRPPGKDAPAELVRAVASDLKIPRADEIPKADEANV